MDKEQFNEQVVEKINKLYWSLDWAMSGENKPMPESLKQIAREVIESMKNLGD